MEKFRFRKNNRIFALHNRYKTYNEMHENTIIVKPEQDGDELHNE